jgi:hypothetical protein
LTGIGIKCWSRIDDEGSQSTLASVEHPFTDIKEMAGVPFMPMFMVLQDVVNRRNADQSRHVKRRWFGYELRKDAQCWSIRQLKHGFFSRELCMKLIGI